MDHLCHHSSKSIRHPSLTIIQCQVFQDDFKQANGRIEKDIEFTMVAFKGRTIEINKNNVKYELFSTVCWRKFVWQLKCTYQCTGVLHR